MILVCFRGCDSQQQLAYLAEQSTQIATVSAKHDRTARSFSFLPFLPALAKISRPTLSPKVLTCPETRQAQSLSPSLNGGVNVGLQPCMHFGPCGSEPWKKKLELRSHYVALVLFSTIPTRSCCR